MTQGPLSGVKVLEFSQIIAAPFGGMHLADMGADVIKFEPIEGESWRIFSELIPKESRTYISLNRGKKGVALDLKRPEAQEIVHRLVKDADVVLTNYRPGVPEAMGIDYETLSAINPRIIYCENTAFGKRGPLAKRPGYDIVVQSLTGLVAGEAKVKDGIPGYIYPAIGDYATGIQISNAICAALYHREKTGKGQRIDITLMGTCLAIQTSQFTFIDAFDSDVIPPMLDRLHQAQAEMKSFEEQVAVHAGGRPAAVGNIYYRIYQTQDGFFAAGALSHPLRIKFLRATGLNDPRMKPDGTYEMMPEGWAEKGPQLVAEAEALFKSKTTEEWGKRFEEAGVPGGPLYFVEELFENEQILANNLVADIEHPLLGHLRMVAPPFQMTESPLAPQGPSPMLGEHTDSTLASAGYSEQEIAALRESGAIR
jgi:formyl-CoA transferase